MSWIPMLKSGRGLRGGVPSGFKSGDNDWGNEESKERPYTFELSQLTIQAIEEIQPYQSHKKFELELHS